MKQKKHELKMSAKQMDVTRSGVSFTLSDGEKKIGTLEVRYGSLTWYSSYKAKKNKYVVSWEEFDKFMREHLGKNG
ncbi:MAG: hypothetical protein IKR48_03770 [Kiritimatiellae bacterium]|nr:hypothetical protein [Kiritimatiellia bacterium]